MSETPSDARHPAVATDAELSALQSLVTIIEETQRGIASLEALRVHALATLGSLADQQRDRLGERRAVREMPLREISAEVAAAVRVSDRVMQGFITDAAQTVALFPATVTALAKGRISRGHMTALVDAGAGIDDPEARAAFEAAALEVAERESVGRFRAAVRGMGERLNPRSMTERHLLAREQRAVSVLDLADGMSRLSAVMPSVHAYGIQDRLTQQAKIVKNHAKADGDALRAAVAAGDAVDLSAVDERTLGQIRVDVLTDLLLAASPALDPTRSGDGDGELGAIRALVQVTVPVLTLAGVEDELVELDGRCPVDADAARELAGDATGWDRVLTHPITGAVLAVDRYTPNADLKRYRSATDRRCRCPGCRMPAHRCDLDHNVDAALGGATEACNLSYFCRRHHSLKHMPGWGVEQLPGGRIEWTTPTGRVYVDEPPPRSAYIPDPPAKRALQPWEMGAADRGRPAGSRRGLREAAGVRFVAEADHPEHPRGSSPPF
ncbi:DUF222 domain-containing protein [Microbacterium sp. P05]|uniref:HNH endonuclease signature motif containing protein n=1 Tax=Microbacterium sp. P05 TaxID=3366948 RepID=UPI0037465A4A